MHDRNAIIDLIEDAERNAPGCSCGAPVVVHEDEGALWLACAERREPGQGVLARVRSLHWLVPHTRRLILSAEELRAA